MYYTTSVASLRSSISQMKSALTCEIHLVYLRKMPTFRKHARPHKDWIGIILLPSSLHPHRSIVSDHTDEPHPSLSSQTPPFLLPPPPKCKPPLSSVAKCLPIQHTHRYRYFLPIEPRLALLDTVSIAKKQLLPTVIIPGLMFLSASSTSPLLTPSPHHSLA